MKSAKDDPFTFKEKMQKDKLRNCHINLMHILKPVFLRFKFLKRKCGTVHTGSAMSGAGLGSRMTGEEVFERYDGSITGAGGCQGKC